LKENGEVLSVLVFAVRLGQQVRCLVDKQALSIMIINQRLQSKFKKGFYENDKKN
jgi:Na+/H+-dicarboxylate symporter